MISSDCIDEILRRTDLVSLVEESRSVVRSGRAFKTLCPFHQERTPSFCVWPESNSYYCFGCHASGNAITYVMETQGVNFPEAVELLAARAGVEVRRDQEVAGRAARSHERSKLLRVTMFASRLYQKQLLRSPNVLEYLKQRAICPQTAEIFQLGFAPAGALTSALNKRSIPLQLGSAAGLLKAGSAGGFYEYFQDRLIFPIRTSVDKVIGFGGRVIPGIGRPSSAKYLNSPETSLYHKGQVLYGLFEAGDSIRHAGEVFVVEGYIDVISLHVAGVRNVVATCGTSFTVEHAQKLSRLTKRILLLFDGDGAGRQAASRAINVLGQCMADLQVVFLPDGADPDSFARSHGSETPEALNCLPKVGVLQHFIAEQVAQFGCSIAELSESAKHSVLLSAVKHIAHVSEELVLVQLIENIAFRLGVSVPLVWRALGSIQNQGAQNLVEKDSKTFADRDVAAVGSTQVALDAQVATGVSELSSADRNLIVASLVLKEAFPQEILADADVVMALHPATVLFLQQVASGSGSDNELSQRSLLQQLGPEAKSLWSQAKRLMDGVSSDKVWQMIRENVWFLRKTRLKSLSRELELRIRNAKLEEQKQELALAQISLLRRLDAIRVDTPLEWEKIA